MDHTQVLFGAEAVERHSVNSPAGPPGLLWQPSWGPQPRAGHGRRAGGPSGEAESCCGTWGGRRCDQSPGRAGLEGLGEPADRETEAQGERRGQRKAQRRSCAQPLHPPAPGPCPRYPQTLSSALQRVGGLAGLQRTLPSRRGTAPGSPGRRSRARAKGAHGSLWEGEPCPVEG